MKRSRTTYLGGHITGLGLNNKKHLLNIYVLLHVLVRLFDTDRYHKVLKKINGVVKDESI